MPVLPAPIEAQVAAHWAAALTARTLFNGSVFCADRISATVIEGHWTEYRRLIAQIADPALFATLQVRALAVCGAVCGPGGVVAGRREAGSVYQAGWWQLPPAGSVDSSAARGDTADWRAALLGELHEELGVAAAEVRGLRPLCLVQHASGVLDLGVRIDVGLTVAELLAAHAAAPHREYDRVMVAPPGEVAALIAAEGGRLVPSGHEFLARL